MDYVRLGNTGLQVSPIIIGCMSFGDPDRGAHPWTLDEEASRPLIRQAIEAGITTFDTANVYSDGSSEEIVGRALKEFGRREELVSPRRSTAACTTAQRGRDCRARRS